MIIIDLTGNNRYIYSYLIQNYVTVTHTSMRSPAQDYDYVISTRLFHTFGRECLGHTSIKNCKRS